MNGKNSVSLNRPAHRKSFLFKVIAFLCSFVLLLPGCNRPEERKDGSVRDIYYINTSVTGLEPHEKEISTRKPDEQLAEMMELLAQTPDKMDYKAPLQMGFEVLSCKIDEGRVLIDVSDSYTAMPATTEILVRAALVRTVTQIDGIKYVIITVNGKQLYDNLGNVVGLLSADQFIDNAGDEINAYEKVRLKLYFANADGTGLIATSRTIAYNTNISIEKLVVEQLLAGPNEDVADVAFPTINPNAKLVSISVKDGICYVNFDENFLTQVYNVSTDVAIYSVVNSLVELTNVNKVQITINGETNIMFRESVSLSTVFERNLNIVTTAE